MGVFEDMGALEFTLWVSALLLFVYILMNEGGIRTERFTAAASTTAASTAPVENASLIDNINGMRKSISQVADMMTGINDNLKQIATNTRPN